MSDNRAEIRAVVRELAALAIVAVGRPGPDDNSTATITRRDLCRICDEVAEQAAEIARLTAELAAARAVPADVEAAIDAHGLAAFEAGNPSPTLDGSTVRLKVAINRAINYAIAEARQPATVGGLLATAPVGAIVEYQRANTQWQARMVDEFATVRFWIERQFRWSKWKIMPVPLSLFARLVPAAEADRDPATRGEICAPAMATTVHCGVCAKPAANKNHEPGGDEQPTCDRCMDATRGPLPKGG